MEAGMFKHLNYVMVNVSDMARSVEFYRDKLGLELKMQSPEWTEFRTGTTTLALKGGGQARTRDGNSNGSEAGTCTIGFNVDDLQTTYEELQGIGVRFVMPPTLREAEGIKLSVCIDPDGLAISIAEMVHQWA
jgi:lactoylglutathione lyase